MFSGLRGAGTGAFGSSTPIRLLTSSAWCAWLENGAMSVVQAWLFGFRFKDTTVMVLSRAWFVPRGGYMFMIEMAGPEGRSGALDATFGEVLRSIAIDE